jgi:hypothetical protein
MRFLRRLAPAVLAKCTVLDTKLGREVVLKVLPAEMAHDPDPLPGSNAKPAPLPPSIIRISSRYSR